MFSTELEKLNNEENVKPKKRDLKRIKYKNRPPKTTRYCRICLKNTKWIYNYILGHSQCSVCGYRKNLDELINYEGKIVKIDNASKENVRKKGIVPQTFLHKLLKKNIICKLINSDILEGTLLWFNQYEIILMVDNDEVLLFKHAVVSMKNNKEI